MLAIIGGSLLSVFGVVLAIVWNARSKSLPGHIRPPSRSDIVAAFVSVLSICGGLAIVSTKIIVEIGKLVFGG